MSLLDREYYKLLLLSSLLGVMVGVFGAGFTFIWKLFGSAVWGLLESPTHRIWVSAAAGMVIGVMLKVFGDPGSMATIIYHFHRAGRLPMRDNRSIQPVSIVGLVAGQSAGPEGALTQAGGSLGAWLAQKVRCLPLQRIMTLAGMGAGFGAFLGAPVGGALLWLEMLHTRGLEYFEAIVPTIVCSCVAYLVMLLLVGHGIVQPWHLPATVESGPWLPAIAIGLGLVCAVAARGYALIFRSVKSVMRGFRLPLVVETTLAGLAIGLLGYAFPLSYFYGSMQIPIVTTVSMSLLALTGLLLAKMLAASLTIHGHWQGGLIIPHMLMGAVLARIIMAIVPEAPPMMTLLCCMAAFNAAATQTPLASALIVLALTGAGAPVPVFLACVTAFIAGHGVVVIENKQPREEPLNFHLERTDPNIVA